MRFRRANLSTRACTPAMRRHLSLSARRSHGDTRSIRRLRLAQDSKRNLPSQTSPPPPRYGTKSIADGFQNAADGFQNVADGSQSIGRRSRKYRPTVSEVSADGFRNIADTFRFVPEGLAGRLGALALRAAERGVRKKWDFKDICGSRNHGIHGNALRATRKEDKQTDLLTPTVFAILEW